MKNTINMNSIMGVRIRKQRKLISPINTTKKVEIILMFAIIQKKSN